MQMMLFETPASKAEKERERIKAGTLAWHIEYGQYMTDRRTS